MRTEVADRGADMEIPAADVQVREIRSSLYPGKTSAWSDCYR